MDEFRTRQIPLNLKFCLSLSKKKKILSIQGHFSVESTIWQEHRLVVKLFINMFPI